MPPNRALSVGKVFVSITNCPEAETYLSNKTLVVKICGAYGWSFEFTVSPTRYPYHSPLPICFIIRYVDAHASGCGKLEPPSK